MIFRDTYSQNLSSWMKIVVSVHVSPISLFLNLIAAQVVFSRTYTEKKVHRSSQNAARIKISHNKAINKGKSNNPTEAGKFLLQ